MRRLVRILLRMILISGQHEKLSTEKLHALSLLARRLGSLKMAGRYGLLVQKRDIQAGKGAVICKISGKLVRNQFRPNRNPKSLRR